MKFPLCALLGLPFSFMFLAELDLPFSFIFLMVVYQ